MGGKGVLYVGPRFGVPGYALLPGLGRPLQASGLPPAWFRYIISMLLLFPGLFRVKWLRKNILFGNKSETAPAFRRGVLLGTGVGLLQLKLVVDMSDDR